MSIPIYPWYTYVCDFLDWKKRRFFFWFPETRNAVLYKLPKLLEIERNYYVRSSPSTKHSPFSHTQTHVHADTIEGNEWQVMCLCIHIRTIRFTVFFAKRHYDLRIYASYECVGEAHEFGNEHNKKNRPNTRERAFSFVSRLFPPLRCIGIYMGSIVLWLRDAWMRQYPANWSLFTLRISFFIY